MQKSFKKKVVHFKVIFNLFSNHVPIDLKKYNTFKKHIKRNQSKRCISFVSSATKKYTGGKLVKGSIQINAKKTSKNIKKRIIKMNY